MVGVRVRDLLGGSEFEVRGALVIKACGPWTNHTLAWRGEALAGMPRLRFVRTVDAVVRPLTRGGHGLAFMGSKPGRPDESMRYFIAPWRGYSVIGSVDYMHGTDAHSFKVEQSELEELLVATRQAIPGAKLTIDDIIGVQVGLIPHDDTQPLNDPYNAARHYRIEDHAARGGPQGLLSVVGIKYTTARDIAQKTVDIAFRKLVRTAAPSTSAERPLHYGHVASLAQLLSAAERSATAGLDAVRVRELAALYGPKYSDVLELIARDPAGAEPIVPHRKAICAQVEHAVRREMACKLAETSSCAGRPWRMTDTRGDRPSVDRNVDVDAARLGWRAARARDRRNRRLPGAVLGAAGCQAGVVPRERSTRSSSDGPPLLARSMTAIYGIIGPADAAEIASMGHRLLHRGAGKREWTPVSDVHLGERLKRNSGDRVDCVAFDGALDNATEFATALNVASTTGEAVSGA